MTRWRQAMKYKEAFDWGRQVLGQAQITEAELDARLLLEYVCQTDRTALFVHGDRQLSEQEQACYEDSINKRAEHIPLQQITGEQNFMGFDFFVNEHVLIPRQDTEVLVEEAMKHVHDGMDILDVCTGSGCILLSLLKYSNDCKGVGIDLSKEALAVAEINAQRLGLTEEGRVTFQESDLFETVEGKFDIIVSNPPYIPTQVVETLMEEVRDHEPRMALDGKEDGLFFYRQIIEATPDYLYRGGMLFFEIGYDQGAAVKELMQQRGFHEVCVKQDYAGLDRVVYGTYYETGK